MMLFFRTQTGLKTIVVDIIFNIQCGKSVFQKAVNDRLSHYNMEQWSYILSY